MSDENDRESNKMHSWGIEEDDLVNLIVWTHNLSKQGQKSFYVEKIVLK